MFKMFCTVVGVFLSGVLVHVIPLLLATGIFDISHEAEVLITGNNKTIFLSFYRAMLCTRGTSHGPVSVRPSVCPSQVGVLLKRLNVGSHKQHHTIAQGL